MKKILFVSFLALYLFCVGNVVYAADVTQNTDVVLQYPDFATAESPADLVGKIFSYAIYISGTLALIMVVYGGIRYIVQAGNAASQKEAMDIIKSAVWGIALLAGAYIILVTINPNLVRLSNLGLVNVELHGNTTTLQAPSGQTQTGGSGGTKIGCTLSNLSGDYFLDGVPGNTVRDQLAYLAQQLLDSGINLSGGPSSCESAVGSQARKDNALQNVRDVAAGNLPVVCEWNSSDGYNGEGSKTQKFRDTCANVCVPGGKSKETTLCPSLLVGLTKLQNKVKNGEVPGVSSFSVSSLTGYLHDLGSPHFGGRGADISPASTNLVDAVNGLSEYGSGFIEGAGTYQQTTGEHIHITYKGSQSSPGSGQQLDDEFAKIRKLAEELTDLGKFKDGISFGIPPATQNFQCAAGSDPRSIIVSLRSINQTNLPVVCDESVVGYVDHVSFETVATADIYGSQCICKKGGKEGNSWVKEKTLRKLVDLQNTGIDYRVISLTGGIHAGRSFDVLGQAHYSGLGFDIVPMNGGNISTKESDWIVLRNAVQSAGGVGGDVKFVVDKIYTGSYFVSGMSWIRSVVTDQNFVNDRDVNDGNLSIYIAGCPMLNYNPGNPTYLYDTFDISGDHFKINSGIEENCYNLRIRVALG